MNKTQKTINNGQINPVTSLFLKVLSNDTEYNELKESIINNVTGYISHDTMLFVKELLQQIVTDKVLKVGHKCNVTYKGKKGSVKDYQSYQVCGNNMGNGYGYVEGIIVHKNYKLIQPWSWNIDSEGNHVDFTKDFSEDWEYYGIVIPNNLVYEIGYRNGGLWYSVLPFIEIENEKEIEYKSELVNQLPVFILKNDTV
jgi:hypothetical protein